MSILTENSKRVWQFAEPRDEDHAILDQYRTIEGGLGISDPMAIPFELHTCNMTVFIESLEQGEPFEIDGDGALKSVEIITAIYRAANEHRGVVLNE